MVLLFIYCSKYAVTHTEYIRVSFPILKHQSQVPDASLEGDGVGSPVASAASHVTHTWPAAMFRRHL